MTSYLFSGKVIKMMINIYRPDQWHDFFLVVGTGAATLTGLLVVTMSLHLDIIIKDYFLRHRAMSILMGLTAVFIRCALVLMGGQNHQAIGFELLTVAGVVAVMGLNSFIQALKHSEKMPWSSLYRTLGSLSCYITEMIGAVILIFGSISGLYVVAIAMMSNFYFMISGSWLLLVGVSLDEK